MLYKQKYHFVDFLKKRFNSLLKPYFIYCIIYLGITSLIAPFVGKFWGLPITFKNEFLMPFLTGHQIDLISPLWFVPQLFTSFIIYKLISYIKLNKYVWLGVYFILALVAIYLSKFRENLYILYLLRTMFSLFFIHLGFLYENSLKEKFNIYQWKIFSFVIILQSILWFTNKDFSPLDGIGLSFVLVWGEFDNWIVPILTNLTGIWISLFIVEKTFNFVKDWNFLQQIGQNTYHIMANHLLIFNIITYSILAIKGIPFDIKNNTDIYWFYCPIKSTYFYFVVGIFSTVFIGEAIKKIKKLVFN